MMGGFMAFGHNDIRLSAKKKFYVRGPTGIFSSVLFFLFCPKFTFFYCLGLKFRIWSRHVGIKTLQRAGDVTSVVIWGTIHLLLHNFDPGYHYKIMLENEQEKQKQNKNSCSREIQSTLSCGDARHLQVQLN